MARTRLAGAVGGTDGRSNARCEVPDAFLGMAVKAVVSVPADAVLTERDVMRHCQTRIERFMVLETVIFMNEIPKTDTGKIKKTGLR